MARGGLSKGRLRCMHDVMASHVARGEGPDIVTLASEDKRHVRRK
jgi:hypothetical protein